DFVRDTSARLQDPPAVRFIKSREPDLNTFRTITGGPSPYGVNYFALNAPNISIARGLQSVNGYDALRLSRQSAISGDMGSDGLVGDPNVFLLRHQGLNLLNVKYMLRERNLAENPINNITIGEINFRKDLLDLDLSPGKSAEAVLGGVMASDLAIVSL